MRTQQHIAWLAACAVAGLVSASGAALAQSFPNRPITLICPWPPGGSTDVHLRQFAQIASKHLGQNVVVENKPGAGGMLGPGTMARTAQPDGYTVSQLPVGAFRIPHMQKVDWDPLKDFTYIIGITGYTFGVVDIARGPDRRGREQRRPVARVSGMGTVPASVDHQMSADVTMAAPFRRHHVVLCDLPGLDLRTLQGAITGLEAEQISLADADNIADRYRLAALVCFERLGSILKSAPQEKVLFQLVVADAGEDELLAGLSGLIDTARLENPNVVGQVVLTGRSVDEHVLAEQLRASHARFGARSDGR